MSEQDAMEAARRWMAEHVDRYLNDPANAEMWDSSLGGGKGMLPTLLLTTTGRKSGEPRHSPLLYQAAGDGFVIIGSKGGAPAHPAWYVNLLADPNAEIRVGAKALKVKARTAAGEERARLWAAMAEAYPPFNAYQVNAGSREIPVVVLDPIV